MKSTEEQILEYNKWFETYDLHCSRMEIINYLIKKNNYNKYLEIGIRTGNCFKEIKIEHKDGVDPVPSPYTNYQTTSDVFFENIDGNFKYDIIFIDGLHIDYQVYKDILNSLYHLEPNGTIICHDMNPPFEICQRKTTIVNSWNGNCWKAFVKLRTEREDLEMFTIDTDWGLGIIKFGKQKKIIITEELDYNFLEKNRKEILNLISSEEFFKM